MKLSCHYSKHSPSKHDIWASREQGLYLQKYHDKSSHQISDKRASGLVVVRWPILQAASNSDRKWMSSESCEFLCSKKGAKGASCGRKLSETVVEGRKERVCFWQ
jgi:hypothetical protein